MNSRVAVIDVGSNSIKALVAERDTGEFSLKTVFEESLEVRISQGIGGKIPMMQPDRIRAGLEAVVRLWKDCRRKGPLKDFRIVATSAVRSATNGHLFTDSVAEMTGIRPVVLSGAEEAEAIAHGVRTDPGIEDNLTDFSVFDLGGGSLELIRFEHHGVTDRTSLPLGSVRLTEQFIADPGNPIPEEEQSALRNFVRDHIIATGFTLSTPLVGCSGGLAAVRRIQAKRNNVSFADVESYISRKTVEGLATEVLPENLNQRIRKTNLPPERADIFPAALLTFQVILDLAGADGIYYSLHNLRYGVAWGLLHAVPEIKGTANQQ